MFAKAFAWKMNLKKCLLTMLVCTFVIFIYQHVITRQYSANQSDEYSKPLCPTIPPNLTGFFEPDLAKESLSNVTCKFANILQAGGFHEPNECKARHRVAVVVAYRDRAEHLPIFLKNMHPFLMKQQLEYGIFIVEQTPGKLFNRAALFNVGFVEAMKLKQWDCFAFHDIDAIPINDMNLYQCPRKNPRHMAYMESLYFDIPYLTYFGGVTMFTVEQFRKINGHSNRYWGWGGEDDDTFNRVIYYNFSIERYPRQIAKYVSLHHEFSQLNVNEMNPLGTGYKHLDSGLSSLQYDLKELKMETTHTWLLVDLFPSSPKIDLTEDTGRMK